MRDIPTTYDQKQEPEIYAAWEDSGYFNPDNLSGEPFTIVMPPPNATGTLHIGHAFEASIQDTVIRYNRMQGFKTLWLPGTDHAAIATNTKVEKILQKEEGKNRHDLGRETFVKKVEDYVTLSRGTIQKQLRTVGVSADWSREAFTFDEPRNLAVRTAFKKMFDAGLIYRGIRVINWDPKGQTSVSDDEVVYKAEKGKLYTFKYAKDFPIAIATTRPETKVGDVAVAVNPADKRYTKFVGQEFDVEFAGAKLKIKIVADASIDPEFGTGAVGVTPAHSVADFEISQRQNLPAPQIINEYAKMMDSAGPLVAGKKTKEAREIIVTWLTENNLLEKTEDIDQNISTAERSGGIIEPLPKLQWFIDVNKKFQHNGREATLKQLMQDAVKKDGIKIMPERFEKVYFHWIDNLRDWNISRQLWYGHRIPVWYCESGHTKVDIITPTLCKQCSSDTPVFGTPHDKAEKHSSIIAYVENTDGKILTINWGKLGGRLLVGGGIRENEDPVECASREITEETGYVDLEHVRTIKYSIVNNYFAASKNVWKKINITALHFRLRTNNQIKQKLEKNEQGKFIVEWEDIEALRKEIKDPAHAYILRLFANIPHSLKQDEDTLDTWFSSALWTFSTLGWPAETKDLKTYHPTSLMAPGYEILFFWVARMILMSTFLLDQIPFKLVYLHGIVRDAKGQKFSKSLDNGVDPVGVINQYGADALRMALMVGVGAGNDSKFDIQQVKGYRNFANKIWNASRFVLQNASDLPSPLAGEGGRRPDEGLLPEDQALLDEVQTLAKSITEKMDRYDFAHASEDLYHYFWHSFADKTIEAAKARLANPETKESTQRMLKESLETLLKLLHPFVPFVTEAIWQLEHKNLLMVEKWPAKREKK